MNRMIISEEEKSRILEMHQSATARQYLMEQTTTQPQAGTTTQPQVVGGGGTAQEKLQIFTSKQQTAATIPSLNQKVITTSAVIKDANTKSLQVDANFDTQTNLKARYIVQCQVNKKGGFSLATNTPDKLNPTSYVDLKTNKEDTTSSYGGTIEPKKGELFNYLNNACNAAFSTQPQTT
jgi:hypothetical protein